VPPCPGGRFLLHELPFDAVAVVVEGSRVSLDPLCPPTTGQLRGSKKGTEVRATWPSCRALTGPAVLKATISVPDCGAMTGVFKGRLTLCFDGRCDVKRFRQPYSATRAE